MSTYLVFVLTILPLVLTPGPDMLFVMSQVMQGGMKSGIKASLGICAGYLVHSVLVAVGVAAIIVAHPTLFEIIRWVGIAYLVYLAFHLLRSALSRKALVVNATHEPHIVRKGFLTSLLNPKVMLIYFAILPQFMGKEAPLLQGLILSVIFIGLCAILFLSLSLVLSRIRERAQLTPERQKWVDGSAGGLLMLAASWLIVN